MTTTASTPLPTASPDLPDGETQSEAPRRAGRLSRGLVAAAVGAVVAITGGVFWLTSGSDSGGEQPSHSVQIVQDGRSGGPDVYEHGRTPDGGFGTTGTQYGSADSLEHQATSRAE
jgi:hypothetical protein